MRKIIALLGCLIGILSLYNNALAISFEPVNFPGAQATFGQGINDLGQIVGYYTSDTGENPGFFYDGSNPPVDITPPETDQNTGGTVAWGINNSGTIVGRVSTIDGAFGYRYDQGTFTLINVHGAIATEVFNINDRGQLVGDYGDSVGRHGFICTASCDTDLVVFDAPGVDFNFGGTRIEAINNNGTVVGSYTASWGVVHGFQRTADGIFTSIDVPIATVVTTASHGIADDGTIIGNYQLVTDDGPTGYLLDTGGFSDLNVPGATSTNPRAINNDLEIVGSYTASPSHAVKGRPAGPVNGKQLKIADRGSNAKTMKLIAQDLSINPGIDMRELLASGAILQVYNPTTGESACVPLPASGWAKKTKRLRQTYTYIATGSLRTVPVRASR